MEFEGTVRITDLALVAATCLGPILAVQAQKFIERIREKRNQQQKVFNLLMSTRALPTRSTPDHMNALNAIPLFFSRANRKEKIVVEAWDKYLDNLNIDFSELNQYEYAVCNNTRNELFNALLKKISDYLGADFSDVDISKGNYFPNALGEDSLKQKKIRDNMLNVLEGKQPLNLNIKDFPVDRSMANAQIKLQETLLKAYSNGCLHVVINGNAQNDCLGRVVDAVESKAASAKEQGE